MRDISALGFLKGIVAPCVCRICGELKVYINKRYPVCDVCEAALPALSGERCLLCGCSLVSELGTCLPCRTRSGLFSIESNISVFEYRDEVRELVRLYKFGAVRELRYLFAERLKFAYNEYYPGITVVPVPSGKKSVKKRGWDHLEEIVAAMESGGPLPVLHILEKTGRRSQKELTFDERLSFIKGTIRVRNKKFIAPRAVVLLDDVYTTGATVNECARTLKSAGTEKVFSLTLAMD